MYAPFRDGVGSSLALGGADKRSYQMDPRNAREAIREALMDVHEGADCIMVKPALTYLDIIAKLRQKIDKPPTLEELWIFGLNKQVRLEKRTPKF